MMENNAPVATNESLYDMGVCGVLLVCERVSNERQPEDGKIWQRGNHNETNAQAKHDLVSGTIVSLGHENETNTNESNQTK